MKLKIITGNILRNEYEHSINEFIKDKEVIDISYKQFFLKIIALV